MVKYFGEPEPVYVGEAKDKKVAVNMYGGVVKPEHDKPGMECLTGATLSAPGQAWGYVQGFAEGRASQAAIGEDFRVGFGPGGVANPDLCSYKSLLRGKELPKSKIPSMVAPSADSEFLQSSNMPRV